MSGADKLGFLLSLSPRAHEQKQKPPPLTANMKIAEIKLYLIRSAFVKRMPKAIEISRCEGEVASVQGECGNFDFFGADDGRGALSARELSNDYSCPII